MRSFAAAVERLAAGGAVTLSRAPEGYDAFVVAALARGLVSERERAEGFDPSNPQMAGGRRVLELLGAEPEPQ